MEVDLKSSFQTLNSREAKEITIQYTKIKPDLKDFRFTGIIYEYVGGKKAIVKSRKKVKQEKLIDIYITPHKFGEKIISEKVICVLSFDFPNNKTIDIFVVDYGESFVFSDEIFGFTAVSKKDARDVNALKKYLVEWIKNNTDNKITFTLININQTYGFSGRR